MRPEEVIPLVILLVCACAPREQRDLNRASEGFARDVRRADRAGVLQRVSPTTRARVDVDQLVGEPEVRSSWAKALAKPVEVRSEAMLFVGEDRPIEIARSEEGWVFTEDPFDRWDQGSPRAALRTLVRASDEQRWDVLLGLAPRRYRIGLTSEDLRQAWTQGEYAEALKETREQLRDHLADAIRADSHEAALDLGEGKIVRLEREGTRWVVVDF
jgi:hypothetical protein